MHFVDELLYPPPAASIFQLLDADGRFVTLVRAMEVAGLDVALDAADTDALTVFAPTDAAFRASVPRR